jgi:hypothetical protein
MNSSRSLPKSVSTYQADLPADADDSTEFSEIDYLRDTTDVWSFVDKNELHQ